MSSNYREKVRFKTLGCKVNQYETEAAMELFKSRGYEITDGDADIYVINTCTVTNLSDSKSRQFIRRAKKINKNAIIVVMGCYAQVSDKEIENIPEVDIIIGTSEREKIVDLVEEYKKTDKRINIVRDISKDTVFQPINIENLKGMTRAYIKVQDGCNRYCSYCIIPYARGNIRSRDPFDTKKEVEKLAHHGYKEIILTGIHIASYGRDLDNFNLLDLIKSVHSVAGIERIRLSSVEPGLITEEFVYELSKLDKFCDHFHLSLQSGSDSVLKRMNRKYTSDEYFEKVNIIRKYFPNAGITTDIIVGFPGETEEEFAETVNFVKKVKFSRIHVFKYSRRKNTPAANMKNQVDESIKKLRSAELTELSENLKEEFESRFIGKTVSVLAERKEGDYYSGHTSNYMEVYIDSDVDIKNKIVDVEIKHYNNGKLFGKYGGN